MTSGATSVGNFGVCVLRQSQARLVKSVDRLIGKCHTQYEFYDNAAQHRIVQTITSFRHLMFTFGRPLSAVLGFVCIIDCIVY